MIKYIVEKRNGNGSLDFSNPQTPRAMSSNEMLEGQTRDQLMEWYLRAHSEKDSCTWDDVVLALENGRFKIRQKNW